MQTPSARFISTAPPGLVYTRAKPQQAMTPGKIAACYTKAVSMMHLADVDFKPDATDSKYADALARRCRLLRNADEHDEHVHIKIEILRELCRHYFLRLARRARKAEVRAKLLACAGLFD